jgi:protocatechuate 3,4-dioxygenase beta subunit
MTPSRRRFLMQALVGSGLGATIPKWGFANPWWSDGLVLTPPQGTGPFYPIPEIEKQKYYDADLTRLNTNSPVADGEQVVIRGSVVNLEDRPLAKVIVEVWQADITGHYNHPDEERNRPIDPHFQYWARMITAEDGTFSFRTIQPGKYPSRAPHIHYRIAAPNRPELATQMYFENQRAHNHRDEVYMDLQADQRKAVTLSTELRPIDASKPDSERLPTGDFKIVLGPLSDSKSTRPM